MAKDKLANAEREVEKLGKKVEELRGVCAENEREIERMKDTVEEKSRVCGLFLST